MASEAVAGWDRARPWYHGSPLRLESIRTGSTITQDKDLARVFSHKPPIVSQGFGADGVRHIKHSGKTPGFLYRIAEDIREEDVSPHPETTMGPGQEWLVARDLKVALIGPTSVVPDEVMSSEEIRELELRGAPNPGIRPLLVAGIILVLAGVATSFFVSYAGIPALVTGAVVFTIAMVARHRDRST